MHHSKSERKISDGSVPLDQSKDKSSHEAKSLQGPEPTKSRNKFAIRMQRHMYNTQEIPNMNANTESKDESSSSRSSQMLSSDQATPLTDSFDLDGIKFSQIPAMSMDGIEDFKDEDGRRTN